MTSHRATGFSGAVLADLHSHTTASDGDLTPTDLVRRAFDAGVGTLAVTDHDTLAGIDEATRMGARLGVRVIAGVELSVSAPTGPLHLLGYFRTPPPSSLLARLADLAERRRARGRRIVERLDALGVPLSLDRVLARAAGSVGRPHVAAELVAQGYAASIQDAFTRYLARGAPAYIPSDGLSPEDAVALVRAAGGASTLAHPATLKLDPGPLDDLVASLTALGLVGIEVHRPEHRPEDRRHFRDLADRHGLVPTGGSDFHRPGESAEIGNTGTPPLPPGTPEILLDRCAIR